jgi:HPt (histidine-containing phosphotransfer) domain-containing protein
MGSGPALNDALNALWQRFLPQMQERLRAIEDANCALRAGTLSPEQRAAASAAAHKLAGVLGSFGLTSGTEPAREAEHIYSSEVAIDEDRMARLESIAQSLKQTIASHT